MNKSNVLIGLFAFLLSHSVQATEYCNARILNGWGGGWTRLSCTVRDDENLEVAGGFADEKIIGHSIEDAELYVKNRLATKGYSTLKETRTLGVRIFFVKE